MLIITDNSSKNIYIEVTTKITKEEKEKRKDDTRLHIHVLISLTSLIH